MMRRRQFLNIPDSDQGMLVYGVLVKEVTNDAAADLLEVRKYFSEQPDFMHGEQSVVDALPILHHVQDQPARFRMILKYAVRICYALANGRQRRRIQTRLLAVRFGERLDHVKRIREIGWDADTIGTSDNRLLPETRLLGDLPRFQKVIPHQMFGGFSVFRILVCKLLCKLLLKLERKHVEVPARREVQEIADAAMQSVRFFRQVSAGKFQGLPCPAGPVRITQATR